MKYAVISDVHANCEALKRVLADAEKCGAEELVCLGDVAGYGPMPAETLALLEEAGATIVAGNHDDAVSGRLDENAFVDLARDAVTRHREAFSRESLEKLAALPYTCRFGEAEGVHGDFTNPQAFNYVDSLEAARANFETSFAHLMFVGHTHIPCIFHIDSKGRVYESGPQDFELERGKRYIVNPGSVGYPRESGGKVASTYAIYDSEKKTVAFRSVPFRIESVMQRGEGGGAPPAKRTPGLRAWLHLAALALLVFAAAFTVRFYCWRPSPAAPVAPRQASAASEPEVVRVEKTAISPGDSFVDPGLRLKNGSPPAILRSEYFSAQGALLFEETRECKRSAGMRKIPKRARKASLAKFTVFPARPGSRPQIESFMPRTAERKNP